MQVEELQLGILQPLFADYVAGALRSSGAAQVSDVVSILRHGPVVLGMPLALKLCMNACMPAFCCRCMIAVLG